MMKLLISVYFILFVCMGCHQSIGSFHDDSLNMEALSKEIDNKIYDGEWDMNPLQVTNSLSDAEIIYGIDTANCESVLIRKSISDVICEEIVLVHSKDNHQKDIMKQFRDYQQKLLSAFVKLPNQQALVKQAEIVSYGNYVLFVCSKDKANVLQYMRSLAE